MQLVAMGQDELQTPDEPSSTDGEVVAGMISVASFPARALFNFGATHSFISSAFRSLHDIAVSPMHESWNIHIGNGRIVVSEECRGTTIGFSCRKFRANLLVYGSSVYDVILRMDWLARHHATIDCH